MSRYARTIPLRLDSRVPEEDAILQEYDGKILGRRVDYLRSLLIAGYQAMHGKTPAPTMFPKVAAAVPEVREIISESLETRSHRSSEITAPKQSDSVESKDVRFNLKHLAGGQL